MPGFDDLLNQAMAARQQFEARRSELFSQLKNANKRQAHGIEAELRSLEGRDRIAAGTQERLGAMQQREQFQSALLGQRERFQNERDARRLGYQVERDQQKEADFAANQQRLMAHDAAIEADRNIRRERDTRIDREGADAMVQMHQLDTAYRSGEISKEEFDDGMLGLGKTHFEALHHHPEAAKHWASYLDQDEKMTQYQQRLDLREAAKLKSKYGVDIQVNPDSGEIDFDSMHKAVLATPKGQSEALTALNHVMTTKYGLPMSAVFENAAGGRLAKDGDVSSFKQTDPNDQKNPQTHVRMGVLSPTGHQQFVVMDKPRFDAIKSEFQPVYDEIKSHAQQPEQQPVETPVTQ